MNRLDYVAFLKERIKEPSTYAGISLLILYFFPTLDNSSIDGLLEVFILVFTGLAVFLPEASNSKSQLKINSSSEILKSVEKDEKL